MRQAILARVRALDAVVRAAAPRSRAVQLFLTAPGIGPTTALAVATAFGEGCPLPQFGKRGHPSRFDAAQRVWRDQPHRPQLPAGDKVTRTHLHEAANVIMMHKLGASSLRDLARAIAERTELRKATVALFRNLALIPHAMWRSGTLFRDDVPE